MNEALLDAIRRGDAEEVAALLDADGALLDGPYLLLGVYHGHAELAALFTQRGHALTIHEAAALGDGARVRELVSADESQLNAVADDGFYPLGLAIFFRHPELARWLIEQGADVNQQANNAQQVAPLHAAAAVMDHATAQLLLARGANPNARQQNDYTPLHAAAGRADTTMARLLLAHGADAYARSRDGKTPEDVAREHGHDAFMASLA